MSSGSHAGTLGFNRNGGPGDIPPCDSLPEPRGPGCLLAGLCVACGRATHSRDAGGMPRHRTGRPATAESHDGYEAYVALCSSAGPGERLALLRAEHGALLAAARATVAAGRDGCPDPLAILRGALARRGQLPPPDMGPQQLLAAPAMPAESREDGAR